MEATGEFYTLDQISAWAEKLVQGQKVPLPKPCRR